MADTTLSGVLLKGLASARPAANAVAKGTVYSATDTGAITQSDGVSTWSTWATIAAAGSVATDAIWDAAGDLAVGTGADTAARLAKGNAGAVLAMGNSAVIWNAGTAFPASKATNDRYWRTDIGQGFHWDGTRWVSDQVFTELIPTTDALLPISVNGSPLRGVLGWGGTYDLWIETLHFWTYVNGGNSGSLYWTVQAKGDASAANIGASFNTSADSGSTFTRHTVTVGALSGTTDVALEVACTRTSTPGPLFVGCRIVYRIVAT